MFGKKESTADLEVFSIYDTKVGAYGVPQFAPNALSLIREYESQFADMQQHKSMLATHSEDYVLFKIGEFTKRTGKIEACTPTSIIGFHEIRTSVLSRVNAGLQNAAPLRDVSQ